MALNAKVPGAPSWPLRPANSWVFFDGQVVRYEDVHLGLMTHALHYGTGCFEGIRAYWNAQREQLFLLQGAAHFDRLRRSGQCAPGPQRPDAADAEQHLLMQPVL